MSTPTPSSTTTMLKPDDVADRMGVSKRTVLRWIERGDLAAFRVGSVTRIELAEFERFLARHRAAVEVTKHG